MPSTGVYATCKFRSAPTANAIETCADGPALPFFFWKGDGRMSRRALLAAAALAAILFVVRPSAATTVVALDDGELARGSRTVLHGDVVSKQSFVAAQGGRIFTEYRFAVRDLVKGAANADGTVVFREWGGEAGGVRYWVPGVAGYEVGEEVVAFLGDADPRTGVGFTYGLAQGKFKVERDAASGRAVVRRDLSSLKLEPRPGDDRAAPPPEGAEPPRGRDLGAFKAKLRAELAK